MSSRGGTRAKGTDGSDFSHRETVASHYQISSTNKSRLKLITFLHFLLFALLAVKLSTEMLQLFQLSFSKLDSIKFPKAVWWEWIWLSSVLSVFPALTAMSKNNVTAMKVYMFIIFLLAICPLLGAIIYYSGDMKLLIFNPSEFDVVRFQGIPLVLLWSIFISVAFLLHTFAIMVGMNLIMSWKPKKGKKHS